ncbi:MAG: PorP/SprF family type IX secretion system membrane protein, partial [Porphyromonadaceae bacterium]|nr:PorP/SprF family type IX secretion system membrane protein [Porphyromonadaceae bacterium]
MRKQYSNTIKSLCLLATMLSSGQRLFAQTTLPVGQYTELLPHFNPASIAPGSELYLRAVHNRQLEGLEGASKSFLVMGDMPVSWMGLRQGVGIQMSNEQIGLFKDTELTARYAIRLKLGKGYLQVGLGGSIISSTFEGSKIFIPGGVEGLSPTDSALPAGDVSGRGIDGQVGLYYQTNRYYIGISANQLLAPNIMLDNLYHRERTRSYTLVAGYTHRTLSGKWQWQPSVLAQIDERQFYRVDMRLDTWYADRFRVALLYRPTLAVGLGLGMRFGKGYIGYQYELPTTELRRASWGNHEILATYSMPIELS